MNNKDRKNINCKQMRDKVTKTERLRTHCKPQSDGRIKDTLWMTAGSVVTVGLTVMAYMQLSK
jgi:hypothetical protein